MGECRDGLVEVFCWCGRQVMRVERSVIAGCGTGECSAGCKARFERYGVVFAVDRDTRGSSRRRQASAVCGCGHRADFHLSREGLCLFMDRDGRCQCAGFAARVRVS